MLHNGQNLMFFTQQLRAALLPVKTLDATRYCVNVMIAVCRGSAIFQSSGDPREKSPPGFVHPD